MLLNKSLLLHFIAIELVWLTYFYTMLEEEFEKKKAENHRKRMRSGNKRQTNYLGLNVVVAKEKKTKKKYDPWRDDQWSNSH